MIPTNVADKASRAIFRALDDIPAADRIGFLFGIVVGLLQVYGLDVREEIARGLRFIEEQQEIEPPPRGRSN